MKKLTTLLFDLDGTLTDPMDGIHKCVCHALEQLSFPPPPASEVAGYIGPPLRETFAALCQSTDEILIERAVELYRERFASVGLYENTLYPEIPETLETLRSAGYRMFVATSKTQVFAERVLEHFSLAEYFIATHGGEFGNRLDNKAHLVGELLEKHALDPEATAMVGDRKYDIHAAKENGVWSIGITYGYGSREELLEAGADHICDTPREIAAYIKEINTGGLNR